jgi:putative oxidoreductase
VGGLAEEAMSSTSNVQRPTPNAQLSAAGAPSNIKHRTSNILWRFLDFVIAGMFIFAGLAKILDLDHLLADLQHLHVANALADVRQLSLASPAEFANDIDNFKILPWPISVALAFYLPWCEIFCGLALIVRYLYRGALSILMALVLVFTLSISAAKVRGLDITCGCFGHASQNWSFPAHLLTNLGILAVLLALSLKAASRNRPQSAA